MSDTGYVEFAYLDEDFEDLYTSFRGEDVLKWRFQALLRQQSGLSVEQTGELTSHGFS